MAIGHGQITRYTYTRILNKKLNFGQVKNRAPKKELIRNITFFSGFVLNNFGFYVTGFCLFPWVLEGLGSSGRLVGTIS